MLLIFRYKYQFHYYSLNYFIMLELSIPRAVSLQNLTDTRTISLSICIEHYENLTHTPCTGHKESMLCIHQLTLLPHSDFRCLIFCSWIPQATVIQLHVNVTISSQVPQVCICLFWETVDKSTKLSTSTCQAQ